MRRGASICSYDELAAIVPDGTEQPTAIDDVRVYEPSTRPGAPLPHAWIEDEAGRRRPIKDLVALDALTAGVHVGAS